MLGRGNDVLAAPLDAAARRLAAQPQVIVQQVARIGSVSQYDASANGTFIYLPGAAENNARGRLADVSASGAARLLTFPEREYSDIRVSPDGRRIAVHITSQQNDVWVGPLAGGALTRLSFHPAEDETPAWATTFTCWT